MHLEIFILIILCELASCNFLHEMTLNLYTVLPHNFHLVNKFRLKNSVTIIYIYMYMHKRFLTENKTYRAIFIVFHSVCIEDFYFIFFIL